MSRRLVNRIYRNPGPVPVQLVTDIVYGAYPVTPSGGTLVDVTYPRDTSIVRPCAIVVHGGTWQGGSQESTGVRETSALLATVGYTVFSIDYRTSGPIDNPSGPYVHLSDTLADYYTFCEWLQANARSYGGDPNLVVALGGSAGGHLVLMGALTGGYGHARPTIAIAWSPATKLDDTPPGQSSGYDSRVIWVTGYPTPQASVGTSNDWYVLSPYYQVVNGYADLSKVPYILLQHEQGDDIAPVQQSREMDAALTSAGISHKYIEYPRTPHAFTALADFWPDAATIARQHIGSVRRLVPNRRMVSGRRVV